MYIASTLWNIGMTTSRQRNAIRVIVKVKRGDEIAKQHHLLVCDFYADIPLIPQKKFVPCLEHQGARCSIRVTKYCHHTDNLKHC